MMMMTIRHEEFDETIRVLAARWSGAAPLLPVFGLLSHGKPLAIATICDVSGLTLDDVEKRLKFARCERDDLGRLVDLFGMTLRPTSIALEVGENEVFSCCGLWAVMIPTLLKREVVVRSVDPLTNEPLVLVCTPDGVESTEPSGMMASMAVAGAGDIARDVGAAFCSHVRFFSSVASAERFAQGATRRRIIEVEELFDVGKDLLRAITDRLEEASTSSTRRPRRALRDD